MEVIEKIRYELYENEESIIFDVYYEDAKAFIELENLKFLEANINDVYEIIINFIKWYNNYK